MVTALLHTPTIRSALDGFVRAPMAADALDTLRPAQPILEALPATAAWFRGLESRELAPNQALMRTMLAKRIGMSRDDFINPLLGDARNLWPDDLLTKLVNGRVMHSIDPLDVSLMAGDLRSPLSQLPRLLLGARLALRSSAIYEYLFHNDLHARELGQPFTAYSYSKTDPALTTTLLVPDMGMAIRDLYRRFDPDAGFEVPMSFNEERPRNSVALPTPTHMGQLAFDRRVGRVATHVAGSVAGHPPKEYWAKSHLRSDEEAHQHRLVAQTAALTSASHATTLSYGTTRVLLPNSAKTPSQHTRLKQDAVQYLFVPGFVLQVSGWQCAVKDISFRQLLTLCWALVDGVEGEASRQQRRSGRQPSFTIDLEHGLRLGTARPVAHASIVSSHPTKNRPGKGDINPRIDWRVELLANDGSTLLTISALAITPANIETFRRLILGHGLEYRAVG